MDDKDECGDRDRDGFDDCSDDAVALPDAGIDSMPSLAVKVARSASPAANRSVVVMRVSGRLGRKTIAMKLMIASGTANRNECAMPCA